MTKVLMMRIVDLLTPRHSPSGPFRPGTLVCFGLAEGITTGANSVSHDGDSGSRGPGGETALCACNRDNSERITHSFTLRREARTSHDIYGNPRGSLLSLPFSPAKRERGYKWS
jgi:hypothetical protein